MADPAAARQLIAGFYGLESNSWRWTAKTFVVTLQPPPGADKRGAVLRLRIFIPEGQFQKLGPMTLSADVDDDTLEPETFSAAGNYTYLRDVPPSVLLTNLVPVIFTLDKAAPPSIDDGRELGAVVTEIALQNQ
ncbi:MAG: hypothetical protein JWO80_893 [Bryobacterales bacterium]|nr:hypothetical protein [Bryobacterales bacterium]